MTTSLHVAEIGLGVRTDQTQSHSCSWHQRKGMLQHNYGWNTALEGTPAKISGAMTGINLRNGRKHAATVRLQDWIVHIATSGGCQRAHTLARVSLLLSLPGSSSCIAVANLSAVTLYCWAVLLLFVRIQNTWDIIQASPCRRPIEIPTFIKHFWWCFNNLKEYADAHPGMPAYFRFMTILGETLSCKTCILRLCLPM